MPSKLRFVITFFCNNYSYRFDDVGKERKKKRRNKI